MNPEVLAALRDAGSAVWLEPEPDVPSDRDQAVLIVSPPRRPVDYPGDIEEAIETYSDDLTRVIRAEDAGTVN